MDYETLFYFSMWLLKKRASSLSGVNVNIIAELRYFLKAIDLLISELQFTLLSSNNLPETWAPKAATCRLSLSSDAFHLQS